MEIGVFVCMNLFSDDNWWCFLIKQTNKLSFVLRVRCFLYEFTFECIESSAAFVYLQHSK